MQALHKTLLSLVGIVVVTLAALYPATQGLRALSADTARRLEISRNPRALPMMPLVDARGQTFLLADLHGGRQRWTVATMVYTRCLSICRATASGMAYLQEMLAANQLQDRIGLLSLSFDPAHDTPPRLHDYAAQLQARPDVWRFATVTREEDLKPLLDLFNIIVLPDGMGGYDHNAALFLIDPAGRLVRAYDINQPDVILEDLMVLAQEGSAGLATPVGNSPGMAMMAWQAAIEQGNAAAAAVSSAASRQGAR